MKPLLISSIFTVFIFLQYPQTPLACQPTTTISPGTRPAQTEPSQAPPTAPPETQPPPTQPPPTQPPPTQSQPTPPPTEAPTTTVVKTTTTTKIQTTTVKPTTEEPSKAPVAQECSTNSGKACVFPFSDTCITDKSEKCIFPFVYRGNTYTACTLYEATRGAWCATQTDSGGTMRRWGSCLPQTCQAMTSPPKQHQSCADFEGSSWCATAVSSEGLVQSWDVCKECSAGTTATAPPTTAEATKPTTATITVTEGTVEVETQTTTLPSGPRSAEMGCGCNCGCKIPAEYVVAIVSGDIAALTEMAGATQPTVGRSLSRRKRPRLPRPRGSVTDLTAALGQAGLQLPVECGCDCSCDVQDVAPLVASESPPEVTAQPPTEEASEAPTEEASESPTEGASESPTEGASESLTEGASESPPSTPTGASESPPTTPDGISGQTTTPPEGGSATATSTAITSPTSRTKMSSTTTMAPVTIPPTTTTTSTSTTTTITISTTTSTTSTTTSTTSTTTNTTTTTTSTTTTTTTTTISTTTSTTSSTTTITATTTSTSTTSKSSKSTGSTTSKMRPNCLNCTTTEGIFCKFPFIFSNHTFHTCTMFAATNYWCSTKVDHNGHHIVENWGKCIETCPKNNNDDEGANETENEFPACPTDNTNTFPASCTERHQRTHKNILFIGNSYTYFNSLPNMVVGLASAAGFSATSGETIGHQTLNGHVASAYSNYTIQGVYHKTVDDWDVVVIQGQSMRSAFPPANVFNDILPATVKLVDTIREKNPCTVPLFYLTWGRLNGDYHNCAYENYFCSFEGMQNRLTESYTTYAYVNQPARVAPVGEAFRNYSDRIRLYYHDGSHPSAEGSFLAACTIFEAIWGVSPVGNTFMPHGFNLGPAGRDLPGSKLGTEPGGVDILEGLQIAAHQATNSRDWSWPQEAGIPCHHCLPLKK